MTKILHIKKSVDEDMFEFSGGIGEALKDIGLEPIGRIGLRIINPGFPSTYGFESLGEGGFVVEYEEGQEVYQDSSRSDVVEVDASLTPLGATGSLIQRTYERLKQFAEEKGHEAFEVRFTGNF